MNVNGKCRVTLINSSQTRLNVLSIHPKNLSPYIIAEVLLLGIESLTVSLSNRALLSLKLLSYSCLSVVQSPLSGAAASDKADKDQLKDVPSYEFMEGEFSLEDVANRISIFDMELCVRDPDGDHASEFYEVHGNILVRTLPFENQVIMICNLLLPHASQAATSLCEGFLTPTRSC